MSVYNGSLPLSDDWSGYLAQAQQFTPTPRLALLALLNVPIFAVVLNILWQFVCVFYGISSDAANSMDRCLRVTVLCRLSSSIGSPSSVRPYRTATTRLDSSLNVEKKCVLSTFDSRIHLNLLSNSMAMCSRLFSSAGKSPSLLVPREITLS